MNSETKFSAGKAQTLLLRDRKQMELQGITEVLRFDEGSVVLSTVCGQLTVEGQDLHIRQLDPEQGSVSLDGRVDALYYADTDTSEKGDRGGFFGRLFH